MTELLYYPGFEIKNEKWLKFALLYLDHVCPIIPYMCKDEREYLSHKFLKVKNGSDLIRIVHPEENDTKEAGHKAICCLENELRYQVIKNGYKQTGNDLFQRWRMLDENQGRCFMLYDGKYDKTFFDYCVKEKFGKETDGGLLLSCDVAEFYMSCLAEAVSMSTGLEMISSTAKHENGLMHGEYWNKDEVKKKLKIAQDELAVLVPMNLDQIPLDKILELRRQPDFIYERKAYIKATEDVIRKREQGLIDYSMEDMLQSNHAIVQLLYQSLDIANDVVQIPLKIMQGVGIAPLVEGSLLAAKLPKRIKNTMETARVHRYANRYLISLRNLSKYYRPAP